MLGIGRHGPLGPVHAIGEAVDGDAGASRPTGDLPIGERDAWVLLACATGVGPVSFARLLGRYGTAHAVIARALEQDGSAALIAATVDPDGGGPSLSPDAAAAIRALAARPSTLLTRIGDAGLEVVTLADPAYPERLRIVDLPPPVLFVRGSVDALAPPRAVAIVGTRRPTEAGRRTSARIAAAVGAQGATVVSGLAVGIDGAAHAAAVAAHTPTIAVIGGGHSRLYPRAHAALADRIVGDGGAIVSEFPPDAEPNRGTFPRRNRIISGLADSTVVVEAGSRSGALTTAAWALEQGRRLFLVPGPIDAPAVAGCLAFLRELAPEARIVAGIPELLEDLELVPPAAPRTSRPRSAAGRVDARRPRLAGPSGRLAELGDIERRVVEAILAGHDRADSLVGITGLPLGAILGAVTVLELRGLVANAYGRYQPIGALAGTRGSRRRRTDVSVVRAGIRRPLGVA
jgi:DNA processing protein